MSDTKRPDWLYGDGCCEHWTPEDGCPAGHTGRSAMSLAARNLGTGGCEVAMGGGRVCGEPAVAVVARTPVCAEHEKGASDVIGYITRVMRGGAS